MKSISKCKPVRVSIGASRPATIALYSDLVRDAFCGALANVPIPAHIKALDIRVSASRDRFIPGFSLYEPGSRKAFAATFDLDTMNSYDLARFVEGDGEWLPPNKAPYRFVLTKPLTVKDFVVVRVERGWRTGQVVNIRDIETGITVQGMEGFDPGRYVIRIAVEANGAVEAGRVMERCWEIGDVRLA